MSEKYTAEYVVNLINKIDRVHHQMDYERFKIYEENRKQLIDLLNSDNIAFIVDGQNIIAKR